MAKVLVVDDSKLMRALIKATFAKIGHEVVAEANNGLEGYEKYCALKPDVVILDITMPAMNGIQALQKIKEYDDDAKIILLTSSLQGAKLNEAIKAGAAGYLFKPLEEIELRNLLDQIL